MKLRVATAQDAIQVSRVYVDSWNQGFGDVMGYREVTPDLVERWRRDLIVSAPHHWWVAQHDRILGFVGIGPSRDPVDAALGELDTIAVAPEVWRQGVGRALMDRAIDQLRADGYRSAVLWTVDGYERGHCFYTAMGWVREAILRDDGRQRRYSFGLAAGTRG